MNKDILQSDNGGVSITTLTGEEGLPKLLVKTRVSSAEIYFQGAHITSFQKNGEEPLLFMSADAQFAVGTPLRGGIPVIFPWFGPKTGVAAHGFARVTEWELMEYKVNQAGAVTLLFQMPIPKNETAYIGIIFKYEISISDQLVLKLMAENPASGNPVKFEECLHTYFKVGDISQVALVGLKGVRYLDKAGDGGEKIETQDAIRVTAEVDRVYQDTSATVEIHDPNLKRIITVAKTGSLSTVVWNPWIAKSKAMADFGDEEYHQMVCVESGNVKKNERTLLPGATSQMSVTLSSRSI